MEDSLYTTENFYPALPVTTLTYGMNLPFISPLGFEHEAVSNSPPFFNCLSHCKHVQLVTDL